MRSRPSIHTITSQLILILPIYGNIDSFFGPLDNPLAWVGWPRFTVSYSFLRYSIVTTCLFMFLLVWTFLLFLFLVFQPTCLESVGIRVAGNDTRTFQITSTANGVSWTCLRSLPPVHKNPRSIPMGRCVPSSIIRRNVSFQFIHVYATPILWKLPNTISPLKRFWVPVVPSFIEPVWLSGRDTGPCVTLSLH